jgi:pyruvyltransferase
MLKPLKRIVFHNIEMLLSREKINAIWYESDNWGDALSPVLIQHFSGKKPFLITKNSIYLKNDPVYTTIGSILGFPALKNKRVVKNTIIWGSGFMTESERIHGIPKRICAVRGPLTRDNLLKTGLKCPEVYGDPVLLYPTIYKPKITKKYKLGVIPHYIDKENKLLKKFANNSDILLIDIESSINTVVDQIVSCKYIASSSLHGIIAADAYGVPSVWIKFSDNIIGGGFKFRDYFGSVGRSETEPLVICEETTVDDIYDTFYNYKIEIDLKKLLEACPFNYCFLFGLLTSLSDFYTLLQ